MKKKLLRYSTLLILLFCSSFKSLQAAKQRDEIVIDGDNKAPKVNGAIVVIGEEGSGKSTFITSIVNSRNKKDTRHITERFQRVYGPDEEETLYFHFDPSKSPQVLPKMREGDEENKTLKHHSYDLGNGDIIIDTRGFIEEGKDKQTKSSNNETAERDIMNVLSSERIKGIIFVCRCDRPFPKRFLRFFKKDIFTDKEGTDRIAPSIGIVLTIHCDLSDKSTETAYIRFAHNMRSYYQGVDKQVDMREAHMKIEYMLSLFHDVKDPQESGITKDNIKRGKVITFQPNLEEDIDNAVKMMGDFKGIQLQDFSEDILQVHQNNLKFERSFKHIEADFSSPQNNKDQDDGGDEYEEIEVISPAPPNPNTGNQDEEDQEWQQGNAVMIIGSGDSRSNEIALKIHRHVEATSQGKIKGLIFNEFKLKGQIDHDKNRKNLRSLNQMLTDTSMTIKGIFLILDEKDLKDQSCQNKLIIDKLSELFSDPCNMPTKELYSISLVVPCKDDKHVSAGLVARAKDAASNRTLSNNLLSTFVDLKSENPIKTQVDMLNVSGNKEMVVKPKVEKGRIIFWHYSSEQEEKIVTAKVNSVVGKFTCIPYTAFVPIGHTQWQPDMNASNLFAYILVASAIGVIIFVGYNFWPKSDSPQAKVSKRGPIKASIPQESLKDSPVVKGRSWDFLAKVACFFLILLFLLPAFFSMGSGRSKKEE